MPQPPFSKRIFTLSRGRDGKITLTLFRSPYGLYLDDDTDIVPLGGAASVEKELSNVKG